MKKNIAMVLCLVLALSMVGCGNEPKPGSGDNSNPYGAGILTTREDVNAEKTQEATEDTKYRVIIDSQYTLECEVDSSYSFGEEVSIKLPTITEHYYSLFANGNEIQMDMSQSDMIYTYFVFTMPDEDVEVVIEDHWVSIP